jgi:hypothetical protein
VSNYPERALAKGVLVDVPWIAASIRARHGDFESGTSTLRLLKAWPKTHNGYDLVRHKTGSAPAAAAMSFDESRRQRQHLNEDGDDRYPKKGPPQSSARDRHDAFSTGKERI